MNRKVIVELVKDNKESNHRLAEFFVKKIRKEGIVYARSDSKHREV